MGKYCRNFDKTPVLSPKTGAGKAVRERFSFAVGSDTPPFRVVRIGNTDNKMVADPTVNNFLTERTS
jgi:hypothetical protein